MEQKYLNFEEQNELIERAHHSDQEAVNELIEFMYPFARKFAVQYVSTGVEMDDLMQEAVCGILYAIPRYVPTHGTKFSTYCTFWIQKMIMAYAKKGTIRCPETQMKWFAKYISFVQEHLALNGREPTEEELIRELKISRESLKRIQDHPYCFYSEDCHNEVADPDFDYDLIDLQILLKDSMEGLTPLEREVVNMRWGLTPKGYMTFKEIGEKLGYSKEWARQIDIVALEKIKTYLDSIHFDYNEVH